MKNIVRILSVALCTALVAGMVWAAPKAMTDQEKRSYAVGANVGKNLKQQGLGFDAALVAKGLVEAMDGKSRLNDDEVAAIIAQLRDEWNKKQAADRQQLAQENQQRGAAFQAEYAKKEGVKALPGGVLYRVLQEGTGEKPTEGHTVLCHYRGTLVNGTVFDGSPPDKPAFFDVTEVIAGWREALVEMPVGSKWELVIPAEKAYGARGAGTAIGPNETLIFEVELVGMQ
jgi:FKBP-type peptidyl-prolyl cis-trans isomerase FklB